MTLGKVGWLLVPDGSEFFANVIWDLQAQPSLELRETGLSQEISKPSVAVALKKMLS